MSIKTKIAAFALSILAVTGSIASTTTQAEARPFGLGWGVGAGIVGAAIVGSAVAASQPYTSAIAAAAGCASSMPMATTWVPFAPAITTDAAR
jgi:hypothetical protein